MVVGDFPIETETIVIGAGPGGYVAAIRAAQLGQKVTIVEKEHLGGVCLNVGCIPSKALIAVGHRYETALNSAEMGITAEHVKVDFAKVQEWKKGIVKKLTGGVEALLKGNKVEIVRGEAYFVDENTLRVMNENSAQTYKFKNAIIATGSRPQDVQRYVEDLGKVVGKLNPAWVIRRHFAGPGAETASETAAMTTPATEVPGLSTTAPVGDTTAAATS
ncbi:MAG: FAD-dependent oxidoreductase, partial [Bacillales bacterium]